MNVADKVSGPQLVEKIVQINGRNLDLRAEGFDLIINYADQPGALGKIGTLLGAADVNILAAQLSQDADGEGRDDHAAPRSARCPQDVLDSIGTDVGALTAGIGGPVMKLAVIAGDGIGPEVIEQAIKVLDVVRPGVEKTEYDLGARRYHATGETLPAGVVDELRGHDACCSARWAIPRCPAGPGTGAAARDAGPTRPAREPASVAAVPGWRRRWPARRTIDLVVVREKTEGAYAGTGGAIHAGTPYAVATEGASTPRSEIERVVHDAFTPAAKRRKKLTLVHKKKSSGQSVAATVAEDSATEYPDVEVAYLHVDATTFHLGQRSGAVRRDCDRQPVRRHHHRPRRPVSGGLGVAASGNIDATRTNPSMFEPVHGSAPDIAGRGLADPTAAVMSVAMLLAHVGEDAAAARVDKAVEQHLATRGE